MHNTALRCIDEMRTAYKPTPSPHPLTRDAQVRAGVRNNRYHAEARHGDRYIDRYTDRAVMRGDCYNDDLDDGSHCTLEIDHGVEDPIDDEAGNRRTKLTAAAPLDTSRKLTTEQRRSCGAANTAGGVAARHGGAPADPIFDDEADAGAAAGAECEVALPAARRTGRRSHQLLSSSEMDDQMMMEDQKGDEATDGGAPSLCGCAAVSAWVEGEEQEAATDGATGGGARRNVFIRTPRTPKEPLWLCSDSSCSLPRLLPL